MQFNKITGQHSLKQQLINNVQQNRLPHAMLFSSAEGTGSLSLVLATIQYLVCENRASHDSCGVCSGCKKVQKLIHPDIHFTKPIVKHPNVHYKTGETAISADWMNEWRKEVVDNPYLSYNDWMKLQVGETNSQGNITVRECAQILHFLSLKSFESGYKFVVIWMAEYLGNEGNRLLKQIEEPEDNTFFFLITENYEQVLGTIQSRSQLIKVPPLNEKEIADALIEQMNISPENAKSISILADGNFNFSLKLLKEKDDNIEKIFLDWMQIIIRKQKKDWVKWAEDLSKLGRENQKQFCKYGLVLLRQILLSQQNNQPMDGWNEREKAYCGYLSQKLAFEQLSKMEKIFDDLFFHIERNANGKLLFLHNAFLLADLF